MRTLRVISAHCVEHYGRFQRREFSVQFSTISNFFVGIIYSARSFFFVIEGNNRAMHTHYRGGIFVSFQSSSVLFHAGKMAGNFSAFVRSGLVCL